jgi:hypothetical protein
LSRGELQRIFLPSRPNEDFAMLKKIALVAAMVAATPAFAHGYLAPYRYVGPHWHPYPDYAAFVPYGLPIVTYSPTVDFVPSVGVVPVRVYYIPQQQPLYNVPPYEEVAPY